MVANWISAFFTVVIACATIAYVWLTHRLWKETKKSADAATAAALAAKQSVELTAALHRPFTGLKTVRVQAGWGTNICDIALVLRNYGTMPSLNTGMEIECFADQAPIHQHTEPSSVQIFPSDEVESPVRIVMAGLLPTRLQSGQEILRLKVRIPYRGSDARTFEYTAQVSYSVAQGRFTIDESNTETLEH